MELWEQILLGIGTVILLLLFWPGAKKAMEESKQAENPDWKGALVPIFFVILFVIILIVLAKA